MGWNLLREQKSITSQNVKRKGVSHGSSPRSQAPVGHCVGLSIVTPETGVQRPTHGTEPEAAPSSYGSP